MARYRVSYKGEHLASGIGVDPGYVFWHGLVLDPEYDLEVLRKRLAEIYEDDGAHSDILWDRRIHFAPKFHVERDQSIF